MKPGDHPEFFRLPPPPGASRESSIVLDALGHFSHEGAPVEKQSLADAMHRWISTHPDDGRWILTNGYDWCYFTVEDTAAFVVGLRGKPPVAPTLVLATRDRLVLDPATLRQDESGHCFAQVQIGGRLTDARLLQHAQTELAPWLTEQDGAIQLEVEGKRYPIPLRSQ